MLVCFCIYLHMFQLHSSSVEEMATMRYFRLCITFPVSELEVSQSLKECFMAGMIVFHGLIFSDEFLSFSEHNIEVAKYFIPRRSKGYPHRPPFLFAATRDFS